MKTITTKKIYSFIIMMVFSLMFVHAQSPRDVQTINPVIGDISWVTRFGQQPDASVNEDVRIQTHLSYAENLLRQKDVSNLSPELQQKRVHNLDLLHDYWTRGSFPRNYDYTETRKPCFIDKDGTICAVGYLVEQTAGRNAAKAINNKFKYEELMAMNDELVDGWIATSGLSKEECAMIQPTYGNYCYCGNFQYNAYCVYNSHNGHGRCKKYHYRVEGGATTSNEITLLDIYPNPVSSSLTIAFDLAQSEKVAIRIFDMTGRLVTVVADELFEEGDNEIVWHASDTNSGIYFLRIEAGNNLLTEKISVVK